MKWWHMPDSMKRASIWVLWVFLAIGAIGWAFFILLEAFNATEHASDWVQAIGTIVALVGAAFLPILHSQHLESRQERATLEQLRFIAEDCYERLWALSNCFVEKRCSVNKEHSMTATKLSLFISTQVAKPDQQFHWYDDMNKRRFSMIFAPSPPPHLDMSDARAMGAQVKLFRDAAYEAGWSPNKWEKCKGWNQPFKGAGSAAA